MSIKKFNIGEIIVFILSAIIIGFLIFTGYVYCLKHTAGFIVEFRKSLNIGNFISFLQATAGAGFFISIIVYLYKYILELDKREKVEGFLENYKVSKDNKRLIITLNLKNIGNYPIEFEFIEKQYEESALSDLIDYYFQKKRIRRHKFKYIPLFLFDDNNINAKENVNEYLSYSFDDRASVDIDKIEDGKNSKKYMRVYVIFESNRVNKPIFINNEIYQNFIYMRVINDSDIENKNYHQNIILPSKQKIKLVLEISKGCKVDENIKINKVCLYSKKGTLFIIKDKFKQEKNARNE